MLRFKSPRRYIKYFEDFEDLAKGWAWAYAMISGHPASSNDELRGVPLAYSEGPYTASIRAPNNELWGAPLASSEGPCTARRRLKRPPWKAWF